MGDKVRQSNAKIQELEKKIATLHLEDQEKDAKIDALEEETGDLSRKLPQTRKKLLTANRGLETKAREIDNLDEGHEFNGWGGTTKKELWDELNDFTVELNAAPDENKKKAHGIQEKKSEILKKDQELLELEAIKHYIEEKDREIQKQKQEILKKDQTILKMELEFKQKHDRIEIRDDRIERLRAAAKDRETNRLLDGSEKTLAKPCTDAAVQSSETSVINQTAPTRTTKNARGN